MYTILPVTITICLLLSFSCNRIGESEIDSSTFFNGEKNEESWVGDGLVFTDSSVFRLLGYTGTPGYYFEFSIMIPDTTSGLHVIPAQGAYMSEVIGGDVIGTTYRSQNSISDEIYFSWDRNKREVTGYFNFIGISNNNESLAFEGEYRLSVGPARTSWTCDFISFHGSNQGCTFTELE